MRVIVSKNNCFQFDVILVTDVFRKDALVQNKVSICT